MEMEVGTALVTVMVMAQVKRSATTAWMTALEMPLALAMVAASETVPDTGKELAAAQDRGRARFVFSRAIGAHHRNRPRSGLLGIDWHVPQAAGARERRAHVARNFSPHQLAGLACNRRHLSDAGGFSVSGEDMKKYVFTFNGASFAFRADTATASLFTWCVVTAFQSLRAILGRVPHPAEMVVRAVTFFCMLRCADERRYFHADA